MKIPQIEDEKEPEEILEKSFKITDFTKQSKTLDLTELTEGRKYRIRGYYQHSLGLKSKFSEWKEFSTKQSARKFENEDE